VTAASEPADIRAPDEVADHLYRIAVEALTNAARHSGCRTVSIALRELPSDIHLVIADDGTGLSTDPATGDGLGLKMMGYRARILSGTLSIDSKPGIGTRVTAVVPKRA